ncbi:MAG TPA: lectin like domain-containing protein [Methanocella sp.]|uniref:lectin like domain-containing protein n=1 Tax=Methanocella sp. TaxID=2052833 RepID=UPI002C19D54B|nr:lectin like domain-containing protein [Methanocella sp.]HTY92080.1 lectin like domain-containing protein [Methanocella sp.]
MGKRTKSREIFSLKCSIALQVVIILALVAAATLASLPVSASVTAGTASIDSNIPIAAPLNPSFYLYQGQLIKSGIMPSTVDLSYLKGVHIFQADAVFPSKYDLRALGKVTPVRDQGSSGCCWAFSTYGSLESTILAAGGKAMDFSENNLKNTHGFDWGPNSGGNDMMSTAYLARWSGPVNESLDPYNPASTTSPSNLPVAMHVQNVYYIPAKASGSDVSSIKSAIMSYGAVDSTIYYSATYYKSSTRSYYVPSGVSYSANHGITIVGWDDNYSAANFTSRPPGNGAFIVKNSWGKGWGDGGYFYVSYYDKLIGTDNTVFTASATSNYNNIYQYDPLGWIGSYGYGSTTGTGWFKNKYTATSNQNLKAVGFYVPQVNSKYQVYVVNGNTNVTAAATSGTITTPGYYTIPLASQVYLTKGTSFTVIVKLTTPGYKYPISVEYPVSGYSSKATASAGQSYISSNGVAWTDTTGIKANMNVCLKAYTVNA